MQAEYFQKYRKYLRYLPSKKFSILIGGVVVLIIGGFIVTSRFGSSASFNTPKQFISAEGTVGDIVSRDSNENGIADWEETLWGLDPAGDGAANKKIVEEKKAAADIVPTSETPGNKTDQFSQELLSTILALQQAGTLTPDILAKVAESIGDSVDAKHTDAHTYEAGSLKLYASNSIAAKKAYQAALKDVISQYNDVALGSEITIIAMVLDGGDSGALSQLDPLAAAYTHLGAQIAGLTTPPAVAQNALDLANASAQMGAALLQVESLYSDVISGMVGLDDYIKASDLSEMATRTLSAYFAR